MYCEIFKNSFVYRILPVAAFALRSRCQKCGNLTWFIHKNYIIPIFARFGGSFQSFRQAFKRITAPSEHSQESTCDGVCTLV